MWVDVTGVKGLLQMLRTYLMFSRSGRKTTRVNRVLAREHHLSDLKHDFLVSCQVLVCR
jgi:hypothetical protein